MDEFLLSQMYGNAARVVRNLSDNVVSEVHTMVPPVMLAIKSIIFPGTVSTSMGTSMGTVAVFIDTTVGIVMWRIQDASQKKQSWVTEDDIFRRSMYPSHMV